MYICPIKEGQYLYITKMISWTTEALERAYRYRAIQKQIFNKVCNDTEIYITSEEKALQSWLRELINIQQSIWVK